MQKRYSLASSVTDRPFGFLMDDFLGIIAKKVLSNQQSYVTAAHVRLLARSRGISLYRAGFSHMRALAAAYRASALPRYCSAAAVMAVTP